jgi:hypothetical protein
MAGCAACHSGFFIFFVLWLLWLLWLHACAGVACIGSQVFRLETARWTNSASLVLKLQMCIEQAVFNMFNPILDMEWETDEKGNVAPGNWFFCALHSNKGKALVMQSLDTSKGFRLHLFTFTNASQPLPPTKFA